MIPSCGSLSLSGRVVNWSKDKFLSKEDYFNIENSQQRVESKPVFNANNCIDFINLVTFLSFLSWVSPRSSLLQKEQHHVWLQDPRQDQDRGRGGVQRVLEDPADITAEPDKLSRRTAGWRRQVSGSTAILWRWRAEEKLFQNCLLFHLFKSIVTSSNLTS